METAAALGAASVLAAGLAARPDPRVRALLAALGHAPRGTRPGIRRLLILVGSASVLRRWRDDQHLIRRLVLAGRPDDAAAVVGARVVGTVAALAIAALAIVANPSGAWLLPVAVAFLPDIALVRRARRRQAEIELHVPGLVELLVAAAEAGLSPPVALRRALEVVRGPLKEELEQVVGEIDLGMPWRVALSRLVDRTDVRALRRLVAAVSRSGRLGTSLRSTLRQVAAELRTDRMTRVEEAAQRAPVKMLFPLVFMVLPAFLLLTVGPVVLATIRSLRT